MRTLLVALSLCLAAGSAGAQTQPAGVKSPAERFAAADANKDGKVDKAEFTPQGINQAARNVATLPRSTCVSGEKRLPPASPPYAGQSPRGGGAWCSAIGSATAPSFLTMKV